MTRIMTATQLKASILSVLDEVDDGDVVEITKHGRTVARLVPARGSHSIIGSLVGMARTAEGVSDEDLFTTGQVWDNG